MKINNIAAKEPLGRLSFRILIASANLPGVYKQRRELISSLLCDSGAIRTLDPRLRRALLYPAELRNQPYFCFCVGKGSAFLW